VIGVPIPSTSLQGMDSLLATVQMPPASRSRPWAIGKPGATNAGILAAQMIGLSDSAVAKKLDAHKEKLARAWTRSRKSCRARWVHSRHSAKSSPPSLRKAGHPQGPRRMAHRPWPTTQRKPIPGSDGSWFIRPRPVSA